MLAGVSLDVTCRIVADVGDLHDVKVHTTLAAALMAVSRVRPAPR